MKNNTFRFLSIVAILVMILSIVGTVNADDGALDPLTPAPSAENGAMTDETPQRWFVELKNPPTVEGTSLSTLSAEKYAFRTNAKKVGMKYTELYAYNTLWNGFSISAKPSEINKINLIAGVKGIFPVDRISMPETTPSDPELFTALNMTGADIVQSELGFTGKGIKVAVMDTGIDVNHPAFDGNGVAELNSSFFFSSPRVKYGYDFVGDAYNADPASPSYNPTPTPDPIPDDCAGHGTHVAGIIGANDATNGLKGVAPEVTFGAYRVFGCAGSTTSDIMLLAMERAFKDGMQVLNMSIGSAFQWPQYPTAVAASRLVDKGMVVVASIGNSGANGLYSAGAPGLGDKVIGVASYDNTFVRLPYFTVNGRNIGYITMSFSPNPPTSGDSEIIYVGRGCLDTDLITPGNQNPDPYLADPNGKTALIVRGVCGFAEKANRAIAAGATAVVVMNNATGVVSGTLVTPLPNPKPVVGISQADGNFIIAQTAPISMTWTDQVISLSSPTGGLISSFSSYGLSPDLALKPDLGAPGGNIYSSYPLELGGYATLSGTSMSSPHVAGAAALFLQAHPKTNAAKVRTYFQNNAVPKNWSGNPGLGYLDQVNRQGAGMLRIDKAILATARVEPSKLSLGESQAGPVTRTLTITNSGNTTVTYSLSSVNALSVRNTFTPSASTSNASVTFSAASVTVAAGQSATVSATINPATGPDKAQYGGYIVFTGDDLTVLRVPFAGFVGDYQSIQALTPTSYGFPWLAVLYGGSFYKVTGPADWVYSLQGDDMPYFLVHFDHQVSSVEFFIKDALTGKPVHQVFTSAIYEQYLPRNSTTTGFFAFAWDGTRIHSNGYNGVGYDKNLVKPVPDGQYIVVIKALKALGDPANPADYETWTSPVIAIDRP